MDCLYKLQIESKRLDGLTGVWVKENKICAFGVRIAQWTTMHGFALNIKPSMHYFDGIIPCGLNNHGITSIFNQLDQHFNTQEIAHMVKEEFVNLFKKQVIYEV